MGRQIKRIEDDDFFKRVLEIQRSSSSGNAGTPWTSQGYSNRRSRDEYVQKLIEQKRQEIENKYSIPKTKKAKKYNMSKIEKDFFIPNRNKTTKLQLENEFPIEDKFSIDDDKRIMSNNEFFEYHDKLFNDFLEKTID